MFLPAGAMWGVENEIRTRMFFLLHREQRDKRIVVHLHVALLVILHEEFQVRLLLYTQNRIFKIDIGKLQHQELGHPKASVDRRSDELGKVGELKTYNRQ